jgi:hypothetical protein
VHQCWGRNLLSLDENDAGVGVIKPSGSDMTVALIQGNQLLIKPPRGNELLGRYALSPDEFYERETDKELNDELSGKLAAFIQVAMQSLRDNRTGVPAQPSR